jgi:hypothetical protein
MRTVTVSSIVTNAASRAGLDGSSIDSLPTTTKTIMVDNLGSHLRDAWEFYDWPDLVPHRRTNGANRSGRGHLYRPRASQRD